MCALMEKVFTTFNHPGSSQYSLMCLTRQGSGSACRSIYGGFVAWMKGELADGTDSIAVQVKHLEN